MNTIEAKLNLHRKSIRRCQLDSIFAQKRMLMQHVVDDDTEGVLFKCLEKIKKIYVERVEDFEEVRYFKLLHTITNSYASIDYFCELVCPIPGQSKNQLAFANVTWLDLLLEFIKVKWQNPAYNQQISAVISGLTYQLHSQIKTKHDGNPYYQQMRRIVQNYPFELLKEESVILVSNTLITLCYISMYDKKSQFNYHLLNKTQPPLLKTLNFIFSRQELLMVAELRHNYMMAGLTIISMINRFHLENLQSDKYKTLCSNLLKMALEQLDQSKSKEEFSKACYKLELIARVKEYSPNEEEFRKFQGYLDREIGEKNISYFKLLKQILQKNAYKMTPTSFKKLTVYLFSKICQQTDEELNLRVLMLRIIRQHCINSGNRLRLQQIQSFMQSWGECASRFVDFADALKYSVFSKNLTILFEVLKHVLAGSPKADELVTEGYLSCLLRFKDYRIILQQIGYVLYGEQQEEDQEYDHYQDFC